MRAVVLLWLAGCSFQLGGGSPAQIDAAIDAASDAMTDAAIDAPVDGPSTTCHQRWLAGTVTFTDLRALTEVNSSTYDRDPTISPDELTLYWSSGRTTSLGGDVWRATRANRTLPFGTPVLQTDVNSAQNETRLSITSNGLLAAIGSDRVGTMGGVDIWLATRVSTAAPWGPATQNGLAAINNGDSQHDPFLSGDGLRLYFAPTNGAQHLEVATRANTSAAFGSPTTLVNSTQGDADPTLSPDERVLVWGSRRTGGLGSDLWYALRASATSTLGTPTLLPSPINSAADEGDPSLSADGCRLYFSSTRGGGLGDYDLYVIDVAP